MKVVVWFNAVFVTIVSAVLYWLVGDKTMAPNNTEFWLAALYGGIGLAFIGRIMMVAILERLGPALFSGIGYLETFLAILTPIVILGERLSITMVVGGIMILIGLYVIEHHKRPHAHHHYTWRHH